MIKKVDNFDYLLTCSDKEFCEWLDLHKRDLTGHIPKIVHVKYYEYVSNDIGFQIEQHDFVEMINYLKELPDFKYLYVGNGLTEYYCQGELVLRLFEYGEIE